jgi:hypothetical protein
LSKNIDNAELSRLLLVAGRGIRNDPNIPHMKDNGNGCVMAKSLLKSNAEEKKRASSGDGLIHGSDRFRYKSRSARKK